MIAWLLSDAASYVNGAVIPVDGSAVAVDVGTLPFDPRVNVAALGSRRPPGVESAPSGQSKGGEHGGDDGVGPRG